MTLDTQYMAQSPLPSEGGGDVSLEFSARKGRGGSNMRLDGPQPLRHETNVAAGNSARGSSEFNFGEAARFRTPAGRGTTGIDTQYSQVQSISEVMSRKPTAVSGGRVNEFNQME